MNLDTALAAIFGAPLERFTEERNRVAKEIGQAGDPDGARRLKALRKPTVSAWAVNRLARDEPDRVAQLTQLHESLAAAGGGAELRRITDERRRLIAGLTEDAGKILEQAGHSASATTLQKISQTLLAASSGTDLEDLRAGRLTRDLESPGFGALSGFELAAESEPFERPDRSRQRRAEELARKAVDAERAAAEIAAQATRAAQEARRLETEATRARERAEAARVEADAALDEA